MSQYVNIHMISFNLGQDTQDFSMDLRSNKKLHSVKNAGGKHQQTKKLR